MPYTPPAGNAADFSFTGKVYAPRMGDDAVLRWSITPFIPQPVTSTRLGLPTLPQSINSTQFGTPTLRSVATTASSGVTFGAPRRADVIGTVTSLGLTTQFGAIYVPKNATGFFSTVFGLPNSPYTQTGTPGGIASTVLGDAHRLVSRCQAIAFGPTSRVSAAYTAVNQTAVASGTANAQFGTPVGSKRLTAGFGRRAEVSGFGTGGFGTPRGVVTQSAGATGYVGTAFGQPIVRMRWMASGFIATKMGTRHKSKQVVGGKYASGFAPGGFGAPNSDIKNRVAALAPVVNFGTPLLMRSTSC